MVVAHATSEETMWRMMYGVACFSCGAVHADPYSQQAVVVHRTLYICQPLIRGLKRLLNSRQALCLRLNPQLDSNSLCSVAY